MRPVIVRRTEQLSPTVKGFSLACADGKPLDYVAGQWVNLHVAVGGGSDKRAYSIASAPRTAADQFDVAVTRVDDGNVSLALHSLTEGSTLALDGPYGYFTREGEREYPALFVGTGTGVCPLRAMIQAELGDSAADGGPTLTLLFGCRSEADLLYRAEFEALVARHPRFRFLPTLSRPSPGWDGRTGYVQTQLAELIDVNARPHVYICGLSPMIDAVRTTLKTQLGYDRKWIHSERYD
ncbi:MAG TPA: FAD-binding oxidoreductase [Polyangiales bacterium]|nr:FAD-binding oxidoreductase [Polyangiales bacterium]